MLAVATLTALLALALSGLGLGGGALVSADTASSMESSLLTWVNAARADRGRAPLAAMATLTDLAGDRAAVLAANAVMDHDAAGCLRCQIEDRGIAWNLYGETLGWTSYAWGPEAAKSLFRAWKGSSSHWDTLMGSAYDIVGVGVARSADGSTYAAIVLVDVPGFVSKPNPTPKPADTPAPTPDQTPTVATRVVPAPAPTADATVEAAWVTPFSRYGLIPI